MFPYIVLRLPSFAWQAAQWSAQCAIASCRTSGVGATGFFIALHRVGVAMSHIDGASVDSKVLGSVRVLKPR